MRILFYLTFITFLTTSALQAQIETEIYLVDLSKPGRFYEIDNPRNISNNPGYDNQPSFTSDGKALLYSSTRENQTDVARFDLETEETRWLSETQGSEYSPLLMPDRTAFSAIQLKQNGEQLLWMYPLDEGAPEVLIPDEVIGYQAWYDSETLYTFVLPDSSQPASTLVRFDLTSNSREVLDEEIGRSIHRIPNRAEISYINKKQEPWTVNILDHAQSSIRVLTNTFSGSEDMAWLNTHQFLMGSGSTLYKYDTIEESWTPLYNISSFSNGSISRIAVSPDQTYIALVVSN
jgi:hypothetical protein